MECGYEVGEGCENAIIPGSIVRVKRRSQASQLLYTAPAPQVGSQSCRGRLAHTELTENLASFNPA